MIRKVFAIAGLSFYLGICLLGVARGQQPDPSKQSEKRQNAQSTEGEKRFQTNCGRCHNPPENISPREARAVVRQMRVKAMLSAEDEKLILEYLAP